MKKIGLTMLISAFLLMLCGSLNAFALIDGDWEFQLADNEVTITGYLGDDRDVVIPDTIYGCPVTKLEFGKNNIGRHSDVTSVVFPKNLKLINSSVLDHNYMRKNILETVVLPEGLEVIGDAAFEGCAYLEKIDIPDTVTQIGNYAFQGCTSLNDFVFPKNITNIGSYVLTGSGVEEITLPYAENIGHSIFQDCKSLESATIALGYETVGSGWFNGCSSLEQVSIPNSITCIDNAAFAGCASLNQIILPTSLEIIEDDSFSGTSIKELVVPYGVRFIDDHAFAHNDSLKSVYLPDTIEDLDPYMLWNSSNAIIYCSSNGYVSDFCKKWNISYLTDNSVNSGITVLYNGTRISFHAYGQNPELLNSRTLVPLRSIFEAMGADVEWDDATSTAIAKRDGVEVKIQIGANEMYKDGKAVPVDVPAMLLNDRTMVPVRVIAEAFGADVDWNGNGRTVLITE